MQRSKSTKASVSHVSTAPLRTKVRSHAKKVLVPHKENQFRPHLIRAQGIIAVLIIALAAQVSYSFFSTGRVSVLGQVSNIHTTELLADTNDKRSEQGLSFLQMNDKLSQAAFLKAQNMFEEQYWAHVSPSGIQPWKWLGDVGYNYSFAGENLAKNYPNADATVEAWMNSPGHRKNILSQEYTDVGFAVVDGTINGENTTLVVALYAAPATVAAVESAQQESGFMAASVLGGTQNPLLNFGAAFKSLSPVSVAILALLSIVGIVGAAAHHYRNNLPKAWKKSWRVHHGLYTFVGMIALGILVIVGAGGGQI